MPPNPSAIKILYDTVSDVERSQLALVSSSGDLRVRMVEKGERFTGFLFSRYPQRYLMGQTSDNTTNVQLTSFLVGLMKSDWLFMAGLLKATSFIKSSEVSSVYSKIPFPFQVTFDYGVTWENVTLSTYTASGITGIPTPSRMIRMNFSAGSYVIAFAFDPLNGDLYVYSGASPVNLGFHPDMSLVSAYRDSLG